MAMRFLNLTHYIQNADYENIADFVLEGAKLKRSKSTPKKNSEEFLMYQLKQHKKSVLFRRFLISILQDTVKSYNIHPKQNLCLAFF